MVMGFEGKRTTNIASVSRLDSEDVVQYGIIIAWFSKVTWRRWKVLILAWQSEPVRRGGFEGLSRPSFALYFPKIPNPYLIADNGGQKCIPWKKATNSKT